MQRIDVVMDESTLFRDVLTKELSSYVKIWHVDTTNMTVVQLIHSYLASSCMFLPWTEVYEKLELPVSLDQHLYGASRNQLSVYSSISLQSSFCKRERDATVWVSIFQNSEPLFMEEEEKSDGEKEEEEAEKVDVIVDRVKRIIARAIYRDFVDQGTKIIGQYNADLMVPAHWVLLFHLISYNQQDLLKLIRVPIVCLEFKQDILYKLAQFVSSYKPTKPDMSILDDNGSVEHAIAYIISNCRYPNAEGISMSKITADPEKSKPVLATTVSKRRPAGTRNSSLAPGDSNFSSETTTTTTTTTKLLLGVPKDFKFQSHKQLQWDQDIERKLADDPRFMEYKTFKGLPMFYPSKDTLIMYLKDTLYGDAYRKDFDSMDREQLWNFVGIIMLYTNGSVINDSKEGKAFAEVITSSAIINQIQGWTTADLFRHMIVAHHPRWKEVYSHIYNYALPVIESIEKYTKQHKNISEETINMLFE